MYDSYTAPIAECDTEIERIYDGIRPQQKEAELPPLDKPSLPWPTAKARWGHYRRLRARIGPAQAQVATAHKLARIVYHILKYKVKYQTLPRHSLSDSSGSTSGALLSISKNLSRLPRLARFSKYSMVEIAAIFSATASMTN